MKIITACDSFTDISVKSPERILRGEPAKFIVASPKIHTPPDFSAEW